MNVSPVTQRRAGGRRPVRRDDPQVLAGVAGDPEGVGHGVEVEAELGAGRERPGRPEGLVAVGAATRPATKVATPVAGLIVYSLPAEPDLPTPYSSPVLGRRSMPMSCSPAPSPLTATSLVARTENPVVNVTMRFVVVRPYSVWPPDGRKAAEAGATPPMANSGGKGDGSSQGSLRDSYGRGPSPLRRCSRDRMVSSGCECQSAVDAVRHDCRLPLVSLLLAVGRLSLSIDTACALRAGPTRRPAHGQRRLVHQGVWPASPRAACRPRLPRRAG